MIASAANGVAIAVVLLVALGVGALFGQRWQEAKNKANHPAEALRGWHRNDGD
jgi:predicted negative regulator of RcsB-dependent stress response